jgi:hypothetical protein
MSGSSKQYLRASRRSGAGVALCGAGLLLVSGPAATVLAEAREAEAAVLMIEKFSGSLNEWKGCGKVVII